MNLLQARYEMLKQATRRPCAVMLGDSLTAGVPWPELTDCPGVANYGWNGDSSEGVLYRLNEIILLHPRVVFLMIGANDILNGTSAAEAAANVRAIVDRLEVKGIAVIVHPVVPIVGSEPRVEELNRAICRSLEGSQSRIIPLPIDLEDLRDGLHLGPTGAAKWHDTIKPLLKSYCVSYRDHGASRPPGQFASK
jgi:lysophospholipase L1-like esterase